MTTIAYDGKFIAFDSRITENGVIVSDNHNKCIVYKDNKLVLTGSLHDYDKFAAAVHKTFSGKNVSFDNIDICGFMLSKDVVYYVYPYFYEDYCKIGIVRLDYKFAIGSGGSFAMGAMDYGSDACGAVLAAMKRDSKSGGLVHTIEVGVD